MEQQKVFIVAQLYQLRSGESSFHMDGFSTEELAMDYLRKEVANIKEEIADEGYEIRDDWEDAEESFICDSADNRYSLKVQQVTIKK